MSDRLALHPDLTDCELEDRTLMAYSASLPGLVFTTFGYVIITTPPGLNSNLNSISSSSSAGSSGSSGGNISSGYGIAGFGPTSYAIGNAVGVIPAGAGGGSGLGSPVSIAAQVGSGANGSGSSAGGTTTPGGAAVGYGGAVSSGYNTGLNSTNNFGMTATPVGAVPVHTYAGGGDSVTPATEGGTGATPNLPAANSPGMGTTDSSGMMGGTTGTGTSSMGPSSSSMGNRLLGKGLGSPSGLLNGPGASSRP